MVITDYTPASDATIDMARTIAPMFPLLGQLIARIDAQAQAIDDAMISFGLQNTGWHKTYGHFSTIAPCEEPEI